MPMNLPTLTTIQASDKLKNSRIDLNNNFAIIVSGATESIAGIVQRASATEALIGTEQEKYVSPYALSQLLSISGISDIAALSAQVTTNIGNISTNTSDISTINGLYYTLLDGVVTFTGNKTFDDDVTVNGTFTATSAIFIHTENFQLSANYVYLNNNFVSGTPNENAGVYVVRGDEAPAEFRWNETTDQWEAGLSGSNLEKIILRSDLNDYIPLTGTNQIAGNLTPSISDTYSLGTSALQWKDLFVTSGSVYFDNEKLSVDPNGIFLNDIKYLDAEIAALSSAIDSESLWNRSGTTLSAQNSGDDLLISTIYGGDEPSDTLTLINTNSPLPGNTGSININNKGFLLESIPSINTTQTISGGEEGISLKIENGLSYLSDLSFNYSDGLNYSYNGGSVVNPMNLLVTDGKFLVSGDNKGGFEYNQTNGLEVTAPSADFSTKVRSFGLLPDKYHMEWTAGEHGLPQLVSALSGTGVDPYFELQGVNVTNSDCFFNGNYLRIRSNGSDEDSAILTPHTTSNTKWNRDVNYGNAPHWECVIVPRDDDNAVIWAGLKASNTDEVATDLDQAYFRYDAVSGTNWYAVSSVDGTDDVQDTGIALTSNKRYHFVVDVDSSQVPRFYINGTLVKTGSAFTLGSAKPFIGIKASGIAYQRNLDICSQLVEENFDVDVGP